MEIGYGRGSIDARLANGYLQLLHPGVYAVGHRALGYRGRWMAAILAGGPGAVASHKTAGAIWDLRSSNSGRIDVTVPVTRHRIAGVTLHRSRSLAPTAVTTHDGFPVTTVERTLVDLAGTLSQAELERAFEQALRLQILDMRKLRLTPGRKGTKVLRDIIAAHDPDVLYTRAELERLFQSFIRARKFPQPSVNVWIAGYEVDAYWPGHALIAELDGYKYHGSRQAFESDRAKTAALQLAGYTVVRITWRMLHDDPAGVAALLQAHFARPSLPLARR